MRDAWPGSRPRHDACVGCRAGGQTLSSPSERSELFPRTVTYALRTAACLASAGPDAWVTGADLAERTGVPPAYASKVLRQLTDAGIIEARRGWHGGYRLRHAPEVVRVHDVLAAVGGQVDTDHCVFGYAKCNSKHPCPLHTIWSRFKDGVQHWALDATLAEAGDCPAG